MAATLIGTAILPRNADSKLTFQGDYAAHINQSLHILFLLPLNFYPMNDTMRACWVVEQTVWITVNQAGLLLCVSQPPYLQLLEEASKPFNLGRMASIQTQASTGSPGCCGMRGPGMLFRLRIASALQCWAGMCRHIGSTRA